MIDQMKMTPELCEKIVDPKKPDLSYQEFQRFSNSIDLRSHIIKRSRLFEKLKVILFKDQQADIRFPAAREEQIFEFMKSEKLNPKFLDVSSGGLDHWLICVGSLGIV